MKWKLRPTRKMDTSTSLKIENKKVTVDSDDFELVIISYERFEVEDETGRVLVYVFKPQFDEDLSHQKLLLKTKQRL